MKKLFAGFALLVIVACSVAATNLVQVNTTSVQTLSNKTLASPALSGTVTGTYTMSGTPTINSPTLSGTITGTYSLAGTPTIISPTFSGTASGSLTGLNLTTPSFNSIINGGTLSLPSSTDTLVGRATTDTLSNKTLASPILSGSLAGTYNVGGTPTLTATLAAGGQDVTGLDELGFNDAAADATAAGRLRRNGTKLTWHDGTSAQALMTTAQGIGNPIINGNMEIWQRGTSFVPITNNSVSADRWKYYAPTTTAVATIQRSTNVPTVAQAGVLFNYSLELDITTADNVVAVNDLVMLGHPIEGYNWRHFAQRQFTLSFWVMSPKSGTHAIGLGGAGSFSGMYTAEYSVSSANTWEFKTITVPASPASGASWNYTNGAGLYIYFPIMAGSDSYQTPGSWVVGTGAGVKFTTSNQQNLADSNTNVFRLTGVKMEVGSVATPIQFRSFNDELALCQRYYQKSFGYGTAPAQNAGIAGAVFWTAPVGATTIGYSPNFSFFTEFRANPASVVTYNPSAANTQVRNLTRNADHTISSITNYGSKTLGFQSTSNGTQAVADLLAVHWTADAEL